MTIDEKLKGTVLAVLAFGFLGFYGWICVEGINLMNFCEAESKTEIAKLAKCHARGGEMSNVMDLFVPISGVITAVAIAALAVRPPTGSSFAAWFRTPPEGESRWPDLLIAIYLLTWVAVGLAVCVNTAFLSVDDAKAWKVEWLHTLGRTWWPTALTAVGMWLGVTPNTTRQDTQTTELHLLAGKR